jgi:hypothetical protein
MGRKANYVLFLHGKAIKNIIPCLQKVLIVGCHRGHTGKCINFFRDLYPVLNLRALRVTFRPPYIPYNSFTIMEVIS